MSDKHGLSDDGEFEYWWLCTNCDQRHYGWPPCYTETEYLRAIARAASEADQIAIADGGNWKNYTERINASVSLRCALEDWRAFCERNQIPTGEDE